MIPAANDIHELVPLYAAGALDDPEARLLESHLPDCPRCRQELESLRESAGRLVLAGPLPVPPASLRDRLMSRIQDKKTGKPPAGVKEVSPGIFVLEKSESGFKPTPFPGVSHRMLYLDKTTTMATSLIRMEPGAKYPQHRHSGLEQCLVLEGDIRMGDTVMRAGDFEYGTPDSFHDVIWTKDGCLLLIVASLHDEVVS